jgi:hypothetical protein
MRFIVDGVRVIAMAAKYNSKKTCFFCAPEGAAPTTQKEQAYITKWPDANRNLITREVPRPAMAARYFGTFNTVEIHDKRRQSELGLETKWVAKGDNAGNFCLATTIFGMAVLDTQLALTCHSYPGNALRSTTNSMASSLGPRSRANATRAKAPPRSHRTPPTRTSS